MSSGKARCLSFDRDRGAGTLVPEQIRWIPATTDGTVERIVIRPGAGVAPDTVILELSNPELEQSTLEARLNFEAAEARYSNRQVEVERDLLDQRAALATTEAQLKSARLQAAADGRLHTRGLVSSIQLQQSQSDEQEYETRYALEQERLRMATDTVDAQLAVERAEVDRLRTLYELRRQQVAALSVRAGMSGVLQQVPLDEGQRITAGTNLARVGDPTVLKAELRVAETEARDVQIGQTAAIDTRNGVIAGRVTRIDPAVENGTVTVDVALDGELPRAARPDLTVDGTIELERMDDILFVGRPVFGQEQSVVSLFQDGGGRHPRVPNAREPRRPRLGQHHRGAGGPPAGRPRGLVRHVELGSVRPGPHRIGRLPCRGGGRPALRKSVTVNGGIPR